MMINLAKNRFKWSSILAGLVTLGAVPVGAQPANFGTLTLNSETRSGVLSGSTGGSTSLPAIVSNRDRNNNTCLGFADPKPDHTLVLQQPFSRLKLSINNGGNDTTIVVSGPNNTIRCSSDSDSKDANLEDTDWQPGTYRVWVGSIESGNRRNYRLTVQGN
ncbi:hypothetical protein [Phormidesmis sp. 146-33]